MACFEPELGDERPLELDAGGEARVEREGDEPGAAGLVQHPVDPEPVGRERVGDLPLGPALDEVEPGDADGRLLVVDRLRPDAGSAWFTRALPAPRASRSKSAAAASTFSGGRYTCHAWRNNCNRPGLRLCVGLPDPERASARERPCVHRPRDLRLRRRAHRQRADREPHHGGGDAGGGGGDHRRGGASALHRQRDGDDPPDLRRRLRLHRHRRDDRGVERRALPRVRGLAGGDGGDRGDRRRARRGRSASRRTATSTGSAAASGCCRSGRRFDPHIFSAEMVALPKPAPHLLLLAAERFGARPERTVMIDDSPHGIEAARARPGCPGSASSIRPIPARAGGRCCWRRAPSPWRRARWGCAPLIEAVNACGNWLVLYDREAKADLRSAGPFKHAFRTPSRSCCDCDGPEVGRRAWLRPRGDRRDDPAASSADTSTSR